MERLEQEREKQLVSIRVWRDEYEVFKKRCRDERTTPTALINKFIREYPKIEQR